MPEPDLNFVLARLDRIQREMREMRLRDEAREASLQTLVRTHSAQMVAIATEVDEKLSGLSSRLDRIEERLDEGDEKLIALSNQIGELRGLVVDIARKIDARAE